MRYSQLLVQAAELAKTEPERAEELLRKAESIALKVYPDDMILCARCWEDYFYNHDNAMRCMLEAECRSSNTSGFLAVAAAHLRHFHNSQLAERCYNKALEIATDSEDHLRIQNFLSEFAGEKKGNHGLKNGYMGQIEGIERTPGTR